MFAVSCRVYGYAATQGHTDDGTLIADARVYPLRARVAADLCASPVGWLTADYALERSICVLPGWQIAQIAAGSPWPAAAVDVLRRLFLFPLPAKAKGRWFSPAPDTQRVVPLEALFPAEASPQAAGGSSTIIVDGLGIGPHYRLERHIRSIHRLVKNRPGASRVLWVSIEIAICFWAVIVKFQISWRGLFPVESPTVFAISENQKPCKICRRVFIAARGWGWHRIAGELSGQVNNCYVAWVRISARDLCYWSVFARRFKARVVDGRSNEAPKSIRTR